MDDLTEIRGNIRFLRQRTTVLTWAVGILAGLTIAILGNLITMSFQLGRINGALDVLINHVRLQ